MKIHRLLHLPWLLAGCWLATPVIAQDSPPDDAWFPKTRTSPDGSIEIFAPQIKSWDDFETLQAWTAFQITANVANRSPYGSLEFTARTDVDLTNREVLLYDIEIVSLSIPGIESYEIEYSLVRDALTSKTKRVPLDLILAYLPEDLAIHQTAGLNPEPPPIYHATQPALVLMVDTEPVFLPIAETGLEFALNANWNLFRDPANDRLFLLHEETWLQAANPAGPWTAASVLPAALAQLPDDGNWTEVKPALPADLSQVPTPIEPLPIVFYTTEPAELIQFEGAPIWQPLAETGIQYPTNSTAECYQFDGEYYFLASGRWFSAPTLEGPWQSASPLPDAFQTIPADHDKAYLLASVPGTREAREAALVASIPVTAAIDRTAASALAPIVTYSGDPVFDPVDGTTVKMAINTSFQVLLHDATYYLCYNATWFRSNGATGPWQLADTIPAEFAKIPPASPAHNTTYVAVEESDLESVTYSSTAGYTNSFVSDDGTVVNGSGFVQTAVGIWALYEIFDDDHYYDGWYPYPYYPWPPTYGYGSWYNPDTGRYGETVVGYGPYGAGRSTAIYNPETGAYGRGQSVWDSDEWAGRRHAYNPNTDTSMSRRGYYDFDDEEGWSQTVKRRGDEWVARETEWEDGRSETRLETSRGGEGTINRDRDGDTTTGTGEFTTGRGNDFETDFTRERDGDSLQTERTIEGENRAATLTGDIEDGQGSFNLEGSEGGSGSFTRERDDGEITGEGSFTTKDGRTIDSEITRNADGVKREFESDTGGKAVTGRSGDSRGFVGETDSGDVYAGRDGEVYKKSADGWEKVEPSQNAARASNTSTRREASTIEAEPRPTRSERARPSINTRQLDSDRISRERGLNRYQSFRSGRASTSSRSFSGGRSSSPRGRR